MQQSTPGPTLPEISDDYMRRALSGARRYTIVVLKRGPAYDPPRSDAIIWEHARRNFALRASGLLSIVCPINDGSELAGTGIFDAEPDEVGWIMAGDPAVKAGVLTYEVHRTRGFPGDHLPQPDERDRTAG
ncbi:MAG TPA: hypothetical protein VF937_08505 [Chloroflexota bacterium]